MSEADLLAAILLSHSRGAVRLFRVNAGVAWQGKVIEHSGARLILSNPRAIKLGPEGMSDLIGWGPGCRFAAVEAKMTGRYPTEAQRRFIDLVKTSGGLAGCAYSVDDAAEILRGV